MPIVEPHVFQARWYLNGFPKSGLHWVSLMMQAIAEMTPELDEVFSKPWAGTFARNSWTNEWVPAEKWAYKASLLHPGEFMYSHCGHNADVERFLWLCGMAHIFIYRDLRDVAVSQAYHVTNEDNERFAHPEKEIYIDLLKSGGIGEVIKACIAGIDKYPGVVERWEQYAGWLGVDWVLKVRFEELAADTKEVARRILRFGLARSASVFGARLHVNQNVFEYIAETMVNYGNMKQKSPTFRKGAMGDWREHFTPEITALFKEHDPNGWLRRLGYEQSDEW